MMKKIFFFIACAVMIVPKISITAERQPGIEHLECEHETQTVFDNNGNKITILCSKEGKSTWYDLVLYKGDTDTKIGTIAYRFIPHKKKNKLEVFISEIKVEEPFRDKGYGTKMMEHVLKHCQQYKCDIIALNVKKTNVIAQKFYRKHGFVNKGTVQMPGGTFYYYEKKMR